MLGSSVAAGRKLNGGARMVGPWGPAAGPVLELPGPSMRCYPSSAWRQLDSSRRQLGSPWRQLDSAAQEAPMGLIPGKLRRGDTMQGGSRRNEDSLQWGRQGLGQLVAWGHNVLKSPMPSRKREEGGAGRLWEPSRSWESSGLRGEGSREGSEMLEPGGGSSLNFPSKCSDDEDLAAQQPPSRAEQRSREGKRGATPLAQTIWAHDSLIEEAQGVTPLAQTIWAQDNNIDEPQGGTLLPQLNTEAPGRAEADEGANGEAASSVAGIDADAEPICGSDEPTCAAACTAEALLGSDTDAEPTCCQEPTCAAAITAEALLALLAGSAQVRELPLGSSFALLAATRHLPPFTVSLTPLHSRSAFEAWAHRMPPQEPDFQSRLAGTAMGQAGAAMRQDGASPGLSTPAERMAGGQDSTTANAASFSGEAVAGPAGELTGRWATAQAARGERLLRLSLEGLAERELAQSSGYRSKGGKLDAHQGLGAWGHSDSSMSRRQRRDGTPRPFPALETASGQSPTAGELELMARRRIAAPPQDVLHFCRAAADAAQPARPGPGGAVQGADVLLRRWFTREKIQEPDVEGSLASKCQLTSAGFGRRFLNPILESYFAFLFCAVAGFSRSLITPALEGTPRHGILNSPQLPASGPQHQGQSRAARSIPSLDLEALHPARSSGIPPWRDLVPQLKLGAHDAVSLEKPGLNYFISPHDPGPHGAVPPEKQAQGAAVSLKNQRPHGAVLSDDPGPHGAMPPQNTDPWQQRPLPCFALSRFDLFHGHLFVAETGRVGVLFHAREYPALHTESFPYELGFCQAGSRVEADALMTWRNILWLAPQLAPAGTQVPGAPPLSPGILTALDTSAASATQALVFPGLEALSTVYEGHFGRVLGDISFFPGILPARPSPALHSGRPFPYELLISLHEH